MQGFPSSKLRGRKREQRDGNLAERFERRTVTLHAKFRGSQELVIVSEIGAKRLCKNKYGIGRQNSNIIR